MCKKCPECDKPLGNVRDVAVFCSLSCKNKFTNRRMLRGAELYDLFMAVRYQRGLAKALGLWSIICGLANAYRKQDEAIRPGFRSWLDPAKLLASKPSLTAKVNLIR